MATPVLKLSALDADIDVQRGDTTGFGFNSLEADGTTVRPIAGFAFKMTVNAKKDPLPADTPLFTLTGAVSTPVVTFTPTESNMDLSPGTYFYDVEERSPNVRTLVKGKFIVKQDITK